MHFLAFAKLVINIVLLGEGHRVLCTGQRDVDFSAIAMCLMRRTPIRRDVVASSQYRRASFKATVPHLFSSESIKGAAGIFCIQRRTHARHGLGQVAGDGLDGGQSGCSAQGHLQHPQAVGQRQHVLHALDHDDGNDRAVARDAPQVRSPCTSSWFGTARVTANARPPPRPAACCACGWTFRACRSTFSAPAEPFGFSCACAAANRPWKHPAPRHPRWPDAAAGRAPAPCPAPPPTGRSC